MLAVRPICKSGRARKDGTSVIFIQYCLSSQKRILLNSGIAIPSKFWNKRNLKVSGLIDSKYGEPNELNRQIRDMVRNVEELIELANNLKVNNLISFLKDNFEPYPDLQAIEREIKFNKKEEENKNPHLNLNLYFQIDDYIASKSGKVTPGMLRIYRNMKEHLQAFEEYRKRIITFDSFDLDFYESFIDYLSFSYIQRRRKEVIYGLKINTIGKTVKQLRIFLRNRMKKKIIQQIDLSDFKITEEAVDAIYLTWEEISKIYKVELSRFPHLVDHRNMFVLACLTGLRFSDFSTIKQSDVRNRMLHKKQGKSDAWVVIPLRNEAQNLFNHEFKNQIPVLTNPEFNRHIKTIGRLAGINDSIEFSYKKGHKDIKVTKPKYEWITSHTCRRSFCTNEFLSGTPVELIMRISGHKSVKDFYKYIRITPEEAGNKIKELWVQRGEMEILNK
jgi:site-specific recombinase XerD